MATLVLLYVGLCCLIAYWGRNRKFGFWGYLVASLLLDPVLGALLVLASDKRAPKRGPEDANEPNG
jgi:hypothetical protein